MNGRETKDSLDEARLRMALEKALVIIVGEYPKEDDRYIWAAKVAAQFDFDLGEML